MIDFYVDYYSDESDSLFDVHLFQWNSSAKSGIHNDERQSSGIRTIIRNTSDDTVQNCIGHGLVIGGDEFHWMIFIDAEHVLRIVL